MNMLCNQTDQARTASGGFSYLNRSAQIMAAFIVFLAAPGFGKADVFNVREAGDVDRLIRVIKRANANNEADTINLAAGTFTLTDARDIRRSSVDGQVAEANGVPRIRTKITINGAVFNGSGSARTTIQRQRDAEEFRIFQVAKAGNLTLNRIRIRGGRTRACGGGIENSGKLWLVTTIVTGNVTVQNCGGGISTYERAILVDSTVSDNASDSSSTGGINNSGELRLVRSTISDNESAESGAGITNSGTLRAVNSTISGNVSTFDGGDSPIGGISNSGTANLRFVSITENEGVGIASSGGTLILSNTILAENGGSFDISGEVITVRDCSGTLTSRGFNLLGDKRGFNLFGDTFNCVFEDTTGDLVGTLNNPINPRLRPLADNGGPTQTHALRSDSPAIDAGDNAVCPDTDQRGFRRPVDGNGDSRRICDIGAFERGALPPRGP